MAAAKKPKGFETEDEQDEPAGYAEGETIPPADDAVRGELLQQEGLAKLKQGEGREEELRRRLGRKRLWDAESPGKDAANETKPKSRRAALYG